MARVGLARIWLGCRDDLRAWGQRPDAAVAWRTVEVDRTRLDLMAAGRTPAAAIIYDGAVSQIDPTTLPDQWTATWRFHVIARIDLATTDDDAVIERFGVVDQDLRTWAYTRVPAVDDRILDVRWRPRGRMVRLHEQIVGEWDLHVVVDLEAP